MRLLGSMRNLACCARELYSLPAEWRVYAVQSMGTYYAVSGCVPTRNYARGPRKGCPDYGKSAEDHRTLSIREPELQDWAERFEAAGGCADCHSTGEVFAGWSAASGTRMKPCRRCSTVEPIGGAG